MRGLMMDRPLSIASLIDFAAEVNGEREVVSRRDEGDLHRYSYRQARARIARLAQALRGLGVEPGDRVATLAWNGHRHFELYYAISGIGAVCHTINPRLFDEQIAFIVGDAEDRLLFVDLSLLPLVERLAPRLHAPRAIVVMTDRAHLPETTLSGLLCYEELLDGQPERIDWPELEETSAAGLCYTSGTTDHPKGVLYSHRSTVLHALSVAVTDGLGLGRHETVLPVVPLFHVNAWGLPYTAPLTGTKLVFPGRGLDGASLYELIRDEAVTAAWGVPTVWLGLLQEMESRGGKPSSLRRLLIGGSAAPRPMIERLERDHDIEVVHGWGMTEMSPIGALGVLPQSAESLPFAARIDRKIPQGRRLFNVEMKIVDETGASLPHDGRARGELLVRGPFVTAGYFGEDSSAAAFDAAGWFRTGDVATIDADGFMLIVDRSKDMIKSGGEWISSIDLENAAIGHPAVAEAAVIGVRHPKWDERPLLAVVLKPGAQATAEEIRDFLAERVARWWLPDVVEFLDELPHTATGKLHKSRLRERYRDFELPEGEG